MRYFFELIDGITFPDLRGMELADDLAAVQEAMRRADHHGKQGNAGRRCLRIRDEKNRS